MWSDNETHKDFLNFRCVADTAAELIVQSKGRPLSMGVSGGWGAGKSTMLNLISDSLKTRGENQFLFVEFNAWLYQGYDDARAALMEVIVRQLIEHAEEEKTELDKAKELLGRVNWLRLAAFAAGSALTVATGVPPVGLIGPAYTAVRNITSGTIEENDVEALRAVGKGVSAAVGNFIEHPEDSSPPQQIQELRNHMEETLCEMGVTLVVFVDDLDRCLPSTAIATLEAIRLFLFLPNTAFIIAADDRMIRQAVRVHFQGADLNDDLVTNYFDKLVQVPLRVPPLGTQEVRAYLMLLYIENSDIDSDQLEVIRSQVCQQLSESWKGCRVDLKFVSGLFEECPEDLRANLGLADRLAPLMTTAVQIAGNPRLIKRFLNTLSIRMSVAQAQDVAVDEEALAKMLLFERCAGEELYRELISSINENDEGKPEFLSDNEKKAREGRDLVALEDAWNTPFVRDWLALPPSISDMDLRSVVYVSREHMPIITPADQLSSESAELLEALLGLERGPNNPLVERLLLLPGREKTQIAERLMARARQEQIWGTPSVLWGLLTIIEADPEQASLFVGFLNSIPRARLQTDIVPVLVSCEWARPALDRWRQDRDTPLTVKEAIRVTIEEGG